MRRVEYWRMAWKKRPPSRFFTPYRAIPSVLAAAGAFLVKYLKNRSASPVDMWIAIGTIVGVYLVLYAIESLWSFVVVSPVNLTNNMMGEIARLEGTISEEREQVKRLSTEVDDLRKPKRTPFQEKEYQAIKSAVDSYDESHKTILRHLLRHGKMTKHVMGKLTPLPTGFREDIAPDVLTRLASDHLITMESRSAPGGWEVFWQIAQGAKSALEELL